MKSRPEDERTITPEKNREHAANLDLDDADVIFLGGQDYAALLLPSVPQLYAPLTDGMGEQRRSVRTLDRRPGVLLGFQGAPIP